MIDLARVRANPSFVELEAKRGRFSRVLWLAMMVIYFGFILIVAFRPDITQIEVGRGVTLAFPLGLAVIVSAIAITAIYVGRANGEFDRLTSRVKADVTKPEPAFREGR